MRTGFRAFDEIIGNLDKARFILVGGRLAMGKSAFAISLAKNIAIDQKIPTAFFSLEMPTQYLERRIVCNICNFDNQKAKNGQLSKKEMSLLKKRIEELTNDPLYIDDTPGLYMNEFDFKVRNLVREHHVKVVFVDYLQLLILDQRINNRKKENSLIAKSLRRLSEDLNITIVACTQISRRIVRGWKKPCLVNLRMYGTMDKYADVVALIHRPEYYHMNSVTKEQDTHSLAIIYIRKNCHGEKGNFRLKFNGGESRFYDPIIED